MPGGLRQVLIHSEISFLRLSVGCEANHFSASLGVATSCRAASMGASASLEGNADRWYDECLDLDRHTVFCDFCLCDFCAGIDFNPLFVNPLSKHFSQNSKRLCVA